MTTASKTPAKALHDLKQDMDSRFLYVRTATETQSELVRQFIVLLARDIRDMLASQGLQAPKAEAACHLAAALHELLKDHEKPNQNPLAWQAIRESVQGELRWAQDILARIGQ